MALFDLIANNTDRKAAHCLRGEDGHIWGIDHGLTFHAHPKLRTVIWDFGGERMPKELLRDLRRISTALQTQQGCASALEELLFPEEIEALVGRIQYVLAHPEFPGRQGRRRGVPWPFY